MIANKTIPSHYYIVQAKGNIVSDMGGEKVMMNIRNGNYYNLGRIGGRIWELLRDPITAAELVETLMSEYEVEQSVCKEHVDSFLMHLMEEHLIHYGEQLHSAQHS